MGQARARLWQARVAPIISLIVAASGPSCAPTNRAYAQVHGVPAAEAIQRISLEYTGCLGVCPAFKVELGRDGAAHYWGRFLVPMRGHYTGVVETGEFERLVVELLERGFFDSTPHPEPPLPTDGERRIVCVEMGAARHCVERGGGPSYTWTLRDAVDRAIAEVAQHIEWRFADDASGLSPNRGLQRPGAPAGLRIERLEGAMSRSLTIWFAWRALAPAAEARVR